MLVLRPCFQGKRVFPQYFPRKSLKPRVLAEKPEKKLKKPWKVLTNCRISNVGSIINSFCSENGKVSAKSLRKFARSSAINVSFCGNSRQSTIMVHLSIKPAKNMYFSIIRSRIIRPCLQSVKSWKKPRISAEKTQKTWKIR